MKDYKWYFKDVAKEILLLKNLRDSYLWSELYTHTKEFLWAVLCFVARVFVLVTFPVSIPLLAFAQMKADKGRQKALEEHKIKLMKQYGVKD